eukprot:m.128612 g.128612  ORF g.128612 m.128612 type:complete len:217 (+) comp17431_c0_seq1:401-1051(+)
MQFLKKIISGSSRLLSSSSFRWTKYGDLNRLNGVSSIWPNHSPTFLNKMLLLEDIDSPHVCLNKECGMKHIRLPFPGSEIRRDRNMWNCRSIHPQVQQQWYAMHSNAPAQQHARDQQESKLTLKQVMLKYGKITLIMHSTVYVATLTCVYVGLRYGAPDTVAAVVEYATKTFDIDLTDGGPLIAAYLLTATTGPARGVATVVCTPVVARRVPKWMR